MQFINQRYFCLSVLLLGSACVDGKFNVDQLLTPVEEQDQDKDGFTIEEGDCNDQDVSIHPEAQEVCDSIDNNCNSHVDEESFTWSWSGSSAEWSVGAGVETVEITIDDEGWDDDDYMADGMLDERQFYHFDLEGRLLQKEVDRGANGIVDFSIDYDYNSLGLLQVENWDQGVNGSIERRISYTYDSSGELLRVERDDDADGIIDARESFSYSADGLTERSIDEDGDGVLEEREILVYAEGLVIERSIYVDGELDFQELSQYSEDGLLLFKDVDSANDGDTDLDARFTYGVSDSDGMRRIEVDQDMDGTVDEVHFEYYDEEGRLLKEGKDFDADDDADQVLSLQFGVRGLEAMHSVNTHAEDEEVILIDTVDAKRFMQTTSIDTRFFEAYIEKDISFTCAVPEEPIVGEES